MGNVFQGSSEFESPPNNVEGSPNSVAFFIKNLVNCEDDRSMRIIFSNGKNSVRLIASRVIHTLQTTNKPPPSSSTLPPLGHPKKNYLFRVPLNVSVDEEKGVVNDPIVRVRIMGKLGTLNERVFEIDLRSKARGFFYEKHLTFKRNHYDLKLGKTINDEREIWIGYKLLTWGKRFDDTFFLHRLGSEEFGFYPLLMIIMEHFTIYELVDKFLLVSKHFNEVTKKMVLQYEDDIKVLKSPKINENGSSVRKIEKDLLLKRFIEIDKFNVLTEFKFTELNFIFTFLISFEDLFENRLKYLNRDYLKIFSLAPDEYIDKYSRKLSIRYVEKILDYFPKLEEFSIGYHVVDEIKESEKKYPKLKIFRYRDEDDTNGVYSFITMTCPNLDFFQFENKDFSPVLEIKKDYLKEYHHFNFKYDRLIRKNLIVGFLDFKTGIKYSIFINSNNANTAICFYVYNNSNYAIKMGFRIDQEELGKDDYGTTSIWYKKGNGRGYEEFYKNIEHFLKKDWKFKIRIQVDEIVFDDEMEKFIKHEKLREKENLRNLSIGFKNEVILETDENNLIRFKIGSIDCVAYLNQTDYKGNDENIRKQVKKHNEGFYLHVYSGEESVVRMKYTLTPLLSEDDMNSGERIIVPVLKTQVIDYHNRNGWGMSFINLNRWYHKKNENYLNKQKKHRFKLEYEILNAWDSKEYYQESFTKQFDNLKRRLLKEGNIVEKGGVVIKSEDLKNRVSIQTDHFKIFDIDWFLEVYPNHKIEDDVFYPGVSFELYHNHYGGFIITGEVNCKINGKSLNYTKEISKCILYPSVATIEDDLNIEFEIKIYDIKFDE